MKTTILIPVYNEDALIEKVIKSVNENIISKHPNTNLSIFEDGSTDNTKKILKNIQKKYNFNLYSDIKRKGYSKVFIDALSSDKSDLVLFMDSDLQYDPSDFFLLLNKINHNDIVGGYKLSRKDSWNRIFLSKILNFLINKMFNTNFKDINSGFKLIKRNVIKKTISDIGSFDYCIMTEFILNAHLNGFKVEEVGVKHFFRQNGNTRIFKIYKIPFIIFKVLSDLIYLKFKKKISIMYEYF